MRLFANRTEAANELSNQLEFLRSESPVVLGLANGGVPIAAVIAERLGAPLDVLLVSRLAAPDRPDQIVGAVDEHGRISMIESSARWHHLTSQQMVQPARKEFKKLQRKRDRLRSILTELDVRGRTVIVVSQGVATGAKMLGAIQSVRDRGANKVIAAAPAGAQKATWQLHDAADQVVIPHQPTRFKGVRHFYEDYSEVIDSLMLAILQRWVDSRPKQTVGVQTMSLEIDTTHEHKLSCEMDLPPGMTRGSGPYPAVIFAHGFESDAKSSRSIAISRRLAKRDVIGVRFDFTGHGRSEGTSEDATDQQMLEDLHMVFKQLLKLKEADGSRIGVCGSGTGGLIALHYAAENPAVQALVIRGLICENALEVSHRVYCPTLLIHAERDTALQETIELVDRELASTHQLLRIEDSNRLFNDPISRELMVNASVDWLVDHLTHCSPSSDSPLKVATTVASNGAATKSST